MIQRASLLFTLLCLVVMSPSAGAQDADAGEVEEDPYAHFLLGELLGPLTEDPLFLNAEVGMQVVQVETGEEVFAYNPDVALTPASVTKVLTAATALRNLGPAYRFETTLLTDGEVTADGVLEGDLYVRGTGDPTLVVEKVWKMIRDLQVAGVVEIEGNVVYDDGWFADDPLVPGWRKKVDMANGPAYFAPLGALSVNYNTVTIVAAPGSEEGQPARLELDTPAGAAVVLVNELETGPKGSRVSLAMEREVDAPTGAVTFTVSGRLPFEGDVQRYYRSVGHPRAYFIGVFEELLEGHGVSVGGEHIVGETPEEAEVLVRLGSPPLTEILNHANKYSSNFMAEQILRAVGAEMHGVPGTTAAGLDSVGAYLSELGIPTDEYTLVNGSGLSRDARLRAGHVNAVLIDMSVRRELAPEFLASLSVGGVDGTLRRRFGEDEQRGLVRGKTGSLNGVYCLAALVEGGDGQLYAMTFLVNGIRRTRPVRSLHDRFGAALLALGTEEGT